MADQNPKLEMPWSRALKTRHVRQEERLGKAEGGVQNPGSGRIWRFHRDGKLWNFLVEARTTKAKSYRIDKAEFLKMEKEALQTPPGYLPAMVIEIQDLEIVAIRRKAFNDINRRLMELEAEVDHFHSTDK